jgi:hypothetical protein
VPSERGAVTRGGREMGEKSPGLEAGVLAAVFAIVLKSIVEKRQRMDEDRHVWWGSAEKRYSEKSAENRHLCSMKRRLRKNVGAAVS